MTLHHLPAPTGGQLTDYSLAGALMSSPVWVHYLTDLANPILTFICVFTGALLGIRRLLRDFKKPDQDD